LSKQKDWKIVLELNNVTAIKEFSEIAVVLAPQF